MQVKTYLIFNMCNMILVSDSRIGLCLGLIRLIDLSTVQVLF